MLNCTDIIKYMNEPLNYDRVLCMSFSFDCLTIRTYNFDIAHCMILDGKY